MPPAELITALNDAQAPVIAGHTNPDVDALGAMLALGRVLPAPDRAVVLPGRHLSRRLRFMLDWGRVPMADAVRVTRADVLVTVDAAGPGRVSVPGEWTAVEDKFVVNIDHHVTNPDYGRINWVVDSASSSCELIYRLIVAAGWPLDGVTASLLYAGIHADTCGFTLPTASAETFEAMAGLVRAGADVEQVGARLYRSHHPHEFDLMRTVYHNTRLVGDGRIAYSTLTLAEIQAAGCTPADIDDQVSIPRSLSGIRIAMLLSEAEPGLVRVNLRGDESTEILPLAISLGGGGHAHSAGVRVRGAMDEVVRRVLDHAVSFLGPSA
ncbi:MAG: DHH family phosphoesterase [Phycisphaerae bacterium]|nr:DHH family phosphoesterase [Phycisphaerae bacterium]